MRTLRHSFSDVGTMLCHFYRRQTKIVVEISSFHNLNPVSEKRIPMIQRSTRTMARVSACWKHFCFSVALVMIILPKTTLGWRAITPSPHSFTRRKWVQLDNPIWARTGIQKPSSSCSTSLFSLRLSGDDSPEAAKPLQLSIKDLERLADVKSRSVTMPIMIMDAMLPGQKLVFSRYGRNRDRTIENSFLLSNKCRSRPLRMVYLS